MNAQQRLHAARLAAAEGRHEEALREYVWFHEHALEEEPSLYGVRLSFALSYWQELAQVYPPADQALREVRDRKAKLLEAGATDRELFHDVEAINQYLGASQDTVKLFKQMHTSQPAFARECASLALEVLVEAHEFELAAKYLADPVARVSTLAARLSEDVARIPDRPRSKSPRYRAYTWNFALDLRTILAILEGSKRNPEAVACKEAAFSELKPWYVRKAIERELAGSA
jgi:hypothetical protein